MGKKCLSLSNLFANHGIVLVKGPPIVGPAGNKKPIRFTIIALSVEHVDQWPTAHFVGFAYAVADLGCQSQFVLGYRCGIHRKFWPEIRAAVEEDVRLSDELRTRFNHVANYQAAAKDILAAMSNDHEFAPADYQSPVPYESLLADDIKFEALASAGAPSAAR